MNQKSQIRNDLPSDFETSRLIFEIEKNDRPYDFLGHVHGHLLNSQWIGLTFN